MHRLLAGATLAIDGDSGHGLRPTGGQDRGAGDVEGLFTGLHHATPDHVIDDLGVDAGPLRQTVEHLRRELSRVHAG